MSDMTEPKKVGMMRHVPLLVLLVIAALGTYALSDYLSFDALRDNRETLLGFRDTHYVATAMVFVLAYLVIVAFSLPGALVATLTGGFLFGTVLGSFYSVVGATVGATVIFLAARYGLGQKLKERMDASEGTVPRSRRASMKTNGRCCFSSDWFLLFLSSLPIWCLRF